MISYYIVLGTYVINSIENIPLIIILITEKCRKKNVYNTLDLNN